MRWSSNVDDHTVISLSIGVVCSLLLIDLGTEKVDLRAQVTASRHTVLFDVLGFVQTVTTMCAYNGGKCFVGRLRPNFFAECDYKGYAKALQSGDYTSYLLPLFLGLLAPTLLAEFWRRSLLSFWTRHASFRWDDIRDPDNLESAEYASRMETSERYIHRGQESI